MYVCKTLDALGQCTEFVEQTALVVPPLSIEDAGTLGGAIMLVWVVAWVCRQLWQMVINR